MSHQLEKMMEMATAISKFPQHIFLSQEDIGKTFHVSREDSTSQNAELFFHL
jgi:hypothetical protein